MHRCALRRCECNREKLFSWSEFVCSIRGGRGKESDKHENISVYIDNGRSKSKCVLNLFVFIPTHNFFLSFILTHDLDYLKWLYNALRCVFFSRLCKQTAFCSVTVCTEERYASSHELCVCAVLCSHFQKEAHKTLFRRKPTTYKKNAPDVRNRLINAPTKYYYTLTHKLNIQLYSPNIRFFSFGIFANNILYKVCRRAVNQNILFNLFKIAIPCNRRVRHKYINRWVEVDAWNRCRNDQ